MSVVREETVEYGTMAHFVAIGATAKRGVEIDDAGERADSGKVLLLGRLGAALHRLNPGLPHETIGPDRVSQRSADCGNRVEESG